jgi:SAM-dependent methyltransferase
MNLSDRELSRIRQTIDMIPPDVASILDVGCGDGRVSSGIPPYVSLTGIDIDFNRIGSYPGNKVIGNIANIPIKRRIRYGFGL